MDYVYLFDSLGYLVFAQNRIRVGLGAFDQTLPDRSRASRPERVAFCGSFHGIPWFGVWRKPFGLERASFADVLAFSDKLNSAVEHKQNPISLNVFSSNGHQSERNHLQGPKFQEITTCAMALRSWWLTL